MTQAHGVNINVEYKTVNVWAFLSSDRCQHNMGTELNGCLSGDRVGLREIDGKRWFELTLPSEVKKNLNSNR